MPGHSIQYLQRRQLDIARWDQCVDTAGNGLIYAYSFYLDRMAKNWDALVLNNYEAVMPLTWNRKYGIHYLYQPPFTASLGIFGNSLTPALAQEFIHAIPKKFRLIEIDLNKDNLYEGTGGQSILRTNYVLSLNRSYEELSAGYRGKVRQDVRRSQQLQNRFKIDIPVEEVIALSKMQMQKILKLSDADYASFSSLYHLLQQRGQARAYGVYAASGELIASGVFFFSHGRACYILAGNHPNGRTLGASHQLIDGFIREQAGQDLLLDFEGSDLRNLAYFFSSFGAVQEIYPALRINRLPWWVRMLRSS